MTIERILPQEPLSLHLDKSQPRLVKTLQAMASYLQGLSDETLGVYIRLGLLCGPETNLIPLSSTRQLCEALGKDRRATTKALDQLVTAGLIVKSDDGLILANVLRNHGDRLETSEERKLQRSSDIPTWYQRLADEGLLPETPDWIWVEKIGQDFARKDLLMEIIAVIDWRREHGNPKGNIKSFVSRWLAKAKDQPISETAVVCPQPDFVKDPYLKQSHAHIEYNGKWMNFEDYDLMLQTSGAAT